MRLHGGVDGNEEVAATRFGAGISLDICTPSRCRVSLQRADAFPVLTRVYLMKLKAFWILVVLVNSAHAAEPVAFTPLEPDEAHLLAAVASAELLQRFHYRSLPLDDAMSVRILGQYLKKLDPERMYFLQSDIDEFQSLSNRLDDEIMGRKLNAPFTVFTRYRQRIRERLDEARQLLAKRFDFDQADIHLQTRVDAPWATSGAELGDLWYRRLKSYWLHLRLAGKNDSEVRELIGMRHERALADLKRSGSADVFLLFMNAYTESIDPHSAYLGPRTTRDLSITMRDSLRCLGAQLLEHDAYVSVQHVAPGNRASRSEQLGVGDRIVGVAGEGNSLMIDVIGWRGEDVVRQICGTGGASVELDVLPADAGLDVRPKRVKLALSTGSPQRPSVTKSLIEVGSDAKQRVGVITLPAFYRDIAARNRGVKSYGSVSKDVERLLAELKAENVSSVLIDLRNNGGGVLDEAVELAGLFIDHGPVAKQRNSKGQIRVDVDAIRGVAWDGPLGVLINRASAAASEVFAAAMQDYGRGIVIGERSFGNGTVQVLLDMDEMAKTEKPMYGSLKLTIAQIFRITGASVQLHGVTPDIPLASFGGLENSGESGYDNALPWMQIEPAGFEPVGNVRDLLPALIARHNQRVTIDRDYLALLEDIADDEITRKRVGISLNEAERRKEREEKEMRLRGRMTNAVAGGGAVDKVSDRRRDVLLDEAAQIMSDLMRLDVRRMNSLSAQ